MKPRIIFLERIWDVITNEGDKLSHEELVFVLESILWTVKLKGDTQ